MHYKNGRSAKNGDKIVYFGWGGPVIGILYDAVPGNDTCNGKLAPAQPNDSCPNLAKFLHLDYVMGALGVMPPGPGVYNAPSAILNLAVVPDTSAKVE